MNYVTLAISEVAALLLLYNRDYPYRTSSSIALVTDRCWSLGSNNKI